MKFRARKRIVLPTAFVAAVSLGFLSLPGYTANAAKWTRPKGYHTRPATGTGTTPPASPTTGATPPNTQQPTPPGTVQASATSPQATATAPTSPSQTATATPSAPASTPAAPAGASGVPLPVGDISGWHQVFADDFTVNAPLGSWGTSNANSVVYTGDHGGKWLEYPDGWSSTYTNGSPGYEPGQVLSTHDGVLDFNLHNVNGLPAGANPSPVLASGSQYQTFGRYTMRFRTDNHSLRDYHIAWLLWPQNDANWQSAESDFPESDLNSSSVSAFAHYGGSGSQDAFSASVDFTQWHTYTQEWGPGYRKYYLDGVLIGTSTNQVTSLPERFQLQTEPSGANDGDSGHLYVDWVAIYAPAN